MSEIKKLLFVLVCEYGTIILINLILTILTSGYKSFGNKSHNFNVINYNMRLCSLKDIGKPLYV